MKKSKFSEVQIAFAHKQAEVGTKVEEVLDDRRLRALTVCRQLD